MNESVKGWDWVTAVGDGGKTRVIVDNKPVPRYRELEDPVWLIWSHEHGCWWAPRRQGYVIGVEFAGRYTLWEALDCCELRSERANGLPNEVVVPSPELVEDYCQRSGIRKLEACVEGMVAVDKASGLQLRLPIRLTETD